MIHSRTKVLAAHVQPKLQGARADVRVLDRPVDEAPADASTSIHPADRTETKLLDLVLLGIVLLGVIATLK